MTKKRILTTAIVLAILGVLIYFQVQHWRSFDWGKFAQASHVNPLQIAIAVALIYGTYALRAVRWKVFLDPVRSTKSAHLIAPTFIGFAGLALLGRPGEFIRPYLIAKKENVTVSSQIGVWTAERIFDVGAFTVLMTLDVFFSSRISDNPYLKKFQLAAMVLCGVVALMGLLAVLIRKRGHQVAAFFHRITVPISANLAHHVDQKIRAFGEGLNCVAGIKGFLKLALLSLAIWFMIALAYRQVAHSYAGEAPATEEAGPPAVDVQTAMLAGMPEMAGQPLTPDIVEQLKPALHAKGYRIKQDHEDIWLMRRGKRVKKVGDRPHLSNMDVPHVVLLMGFSMVGSIVQLPAVGGGSQLAVISALQVIYGIPPELAVSCGILLWLVTFVSVVPAGLALAHFEHISLRKISKESEKEERSENLPPAPYPDPADTRAR